MFSLRLKELRESSFPSQRAFAQIFGVASSTVGMWESGKREPDYATTIKLADFFNVTVGYLIGHENEKKPATVVGDELSKMENDLLKVFKLVPQEQQSLLLGMIEGAARNQGLFDPPEE